MRGTQASGASVQEMTEGDAGCAKSAKWEVNVVRSRTTPRRPLMLGRLVLEPQHVGVKQEVDAKFHVRVIHITGPLDSQGYPQVFHKFIHRTCAGSGARAHCDGSPDPAEDRLELGPTASYVETDP